MQQASSREGVVLPMGLEPKSYACVRSIARNGLKPVVASEYEHVPAAHSRFCSECVRLPAPDEDLLAYRDALLELASRPDISTILPLRCRDTYLFSKYQSAFEEHVSLVTPPMETLRTVHDRLQLVAAAENAGVPVPESCLLSELRDRDREIVIKSRYNLLVSEYLDAYSETESATTDTVFHCARDEPLDRERVRTTVGHDPIVQEFIPSRNEYLFGAVCDHGTPLATFQHRQIRGDSYTGGGGVYRETTAIPELEQVGRKLLEAIDYHGVACIEYMKHAETGEFYLTEINPRFWQSVPCAIRAGAEFPWYYYLQAVDRADRIDPNYQVGVGTHQLYGEAMYLQSLLTDDTSVVERPSFPGAVLEIARSCLKQPRFDDFRLDDPMPFLLSLGHFCWKGTHAISQASDEATGSAVQTVSEPATD